MMENILPNRPRYYADILGYVRPDLLKFVVLLERELRANDHKGPTGWKNDSPSSLLSRVEEELNELKEIVAEDTDPNDPSAVGVRRDLIAEEASDVANMTMMYLDVLGILPELQACSPTERARNMIIARVKELLSHGGMLFVDVESWAASKPGPLRDLAEAYLQLLAEEIAQKWLQDASLIEAP